VSTSNISQNIIPAKETEVLGFILEGLTTKEIGSKLFETCSVVVNKYRSKRTVGQADMTLALLGQNLFKYLGII